MQLTPLTFLSQAEPVVDSRFTWLPQINPWLLLAFFIIAAAAAFYLYKAQRRIAPLGAVIALTTIRTLLILLIFLVLLGAGRVFTRTGEVNGTLWFMLDQSQSMERPDPQATSIEKLRWADSLGMLPEGVRPAALDRQVARLTVLQADLSYLQSLTQHPVEEKEQRKRVEEIVRSLKKWNSLLTGSADAIDKDPSAKNEGTVSKSLRSTVDSVARGIEKVDTRQKPEEAQADIDWNAARTAIAQATEKLTKLADKADEAIVAKQDAKVVEAIEKVGKMSRAELARQAITHKSRTGVAGFDELMPKQTVKVMGFGERPQAAEPQDQGEAVKSINTAFAKPEAPVTDMASALQAIQDRLSQSEPATVVLVSDGRQNRREGDTSEAVRKLASRGVRVFSLALGTSQVAPDAAVETVDAPDWVFKGDTVKIKSLLRLDGLIGKKVEVDLHRTRKDTGRLQGADTKDTLVDSKQFTVERERDFVSFSEKKENLPEAGLYDYRIEIKPVEQETVTANNSKTMRVSVKETKLTVLMLEDQPRWEYRYIRSYLERETRVKLQSMLLQPARIGWDNDPSKNIKPPTPRKPSTDEKETNIDFQILPETQEEWYQWDFIILGDIPPEKLPKKQQEMIAKAVMTGGKTLLVLSGPLNMPAAWGTNQTEHPLTALFPCETSNEWSPAKMAAHMKVGYHPVVAPDGEGHLLTQFGMDEDQNKQIWQSIMTDPNLAWYWHSEYTQARGGTSVLWSIADNLPSGQAAPVTGAPTTQMSEDKGPTTLEQAQRRALLATMNAGLGKVLYMSGDASWRLRQVKGVNYHERFWGQVIRWVVGNELPAGGQFVRFGTDQPRYVGGEQAMVTARVYNNKLEPFTGLKVKVQARVISADGKVDPNSKSVVDAEMNEIPDAPGRYRATLGNLPPGQVELTLQGPEVEKLLADDPKALQKTLTVEVADSLNLEQRNINADLRALGSIASAGGGVMIDGAYADVLAEHIPELRYTASSAEQISLFGNPNDKYTQWTHWGFLAVFVGLITAEWIIRKANGLV